MNQRARGCSVALKGTVDWRMVLSGLVSFVLKSGGRFFQLLPQEWSFLMFSKSHNGSVFLASLGKSLGVHGPAKCSYGTSPVVVVAVVFGTAPASRSISREVLPLKLSARRCQRLHVAAFALSSPQPPPLLAASKIPIARGVISLLLTPVWAGRCAHRLQSRWD